MTDVKTPLLDELESGPWPSFIKEIKKSQNPMTDDLLRVLELSYKERIGHWKHGGIVGVMGYGGGVIGRYNDMPEEFPNVACNSPLIPNHLPSRVRSQYSSALILLSFSELPSFSIRR